jgi:hypothetical protein
MERHHSVNCPGIGDTLLTRAQMGSNETFPCLKFHLSRRTKWAFFKGASFLVTNSRQVQASLRSGINFGGKNPEKS